MVILGIDPGLSVTGVAVGQKDKSSLRIIYSQEIKTKARQSLGSRISLIYSCLDEVINRFKPQVMVLEKLYSHYRHPTTAILLGHARGAIILLAAQKSLEVIEYPATQVKKAVTSKGSASKDQVKRMVSYLSGLDKPLASQHVADAMALVLAYLHTQK